VSTAARKARKAAGERFVHPVKVGTPLEDRRLAGGQSDILTRPYSGRALKSAERLMKASQGLLRWRTNADGVQK
jgi:hypothetical protein